MKLTPNPMMEAKTKTHTPFSKNFLNLTHTIPLTNTLI